MAACPWNCFFVFSIDSQSHGHAYRLIAMCCPAPVHRRQDPPHVQPCLHRHLHGVPSAALMAPGELMDPPVDPEMSPSGEEYRPLPSGPRERLTDLSPYSLPWPKGRNLRRGRGGARQISPLPTHMHTHAHLLAQVHTLMQTPSTSATLLPLPPPPQGTQNRR